MKWIRRVANITFFTSFCMNPASVDPMKWFRRVVKFTIFASFCMNPASGDPMKWIRRVVKITVFASFFMNPARKSFHDFSRKGRGSKNSSCVRRSRRGKPTEHHFQTLKKHDFCNILYESSLGRCIAIDSQPYEKHYVYSFLYESSLGRCNEMDSQPCKKTRVLHHFV